VFAQFGPSVTSSLSPAPASHQCLTIQIHSYFQISQGVRWEQIPKTVLSLVWVLDHETLPAF